jgi:hypothetical protein
LIQADHLASASKSVHAGATAGHIFANTVLDRRGNSVLADTLPLHLQKTRQAVDPYFAGMDGAFVQLPAWTPAKDSMLFARTSPAAFQWQADAASKVASVADIKNRPFFAMVVSGTGAGKTIGGPKVLAAASGGELRYTCGLGLRSLTLQTGAVYRKQLSIPAEALRTVVGDVLYTALMAEKKEMSVFEAAGSESLAQDENWVLDSPVTGETIKTALGFDTAQKEALGTTKALALSELPVLVCTVDHLMGASVLKKGTDVRMALRLATADLILDEIDNYSLEDLVALGRLVHHAGCHGRRVVVMSATVSAAVLQGLYSAWHAGIETWQFRTGRKESAVLALVGNQVPSCVVEHRSEEQVFACVQSFVGDICLSLTQSLRNVRCQWLPPAKTVPETFARMYQEALGLSRVHRTTHPETGKTISMGFVRFNQVKHCRRFAEYLFDSATEPAEASLRVQCYHRRMPLAHLAHVELTLNSLLNRKDEAAVWDMPVVKAWMENEPEAKNLVLIVSTTSIQETGRDHDYDWAVTEPWSTRSLVQLSGRVRRHRGPGVAAPNVSVLEHEIVCCEPKFRAGGNTLELGREALFNINGVVPVGFEGLMATTRKDSYFERCWPGLSKQAGRTIAPPEKSVLSRRGWLPAEFFETGVSAAPCLNREAAEAAHLTWAEHQAQGRRMARPETGGGLSLHDIVNCGFDGQVPELLWNRHNHYVDFRRSTARMAQLTLDPSNEFLSLSVVERHPTTHQVGLKPYAMPKSWKGGTRIANTRRALIPLQEFGMDMAYLDLGYVPKAGSLAAQLLHSFEVHLYPVKEGWEQPTSVQVDFDPLLGADHFREAD